MIDSMQEEIDKRFLKGIAASPGMVIGKAYVFQDTLLFVERRDLEEGCADKEIVRLNQAIRLVIDELVEDNFQTSKRVHAWKQKPAILIRASDVPMMRVIAQISEEGVTVLHKVKAIALRKGTF